MALGGGGPSTKVGSGSGQVSAPHVVGVGGLEPRASLRKAIVLVIIAHNTLLCLAYLTAILYYLQLTNCT